MSRNMVEKLDCNNCGGFMYKVDWCSEGKYKCDGCMGDMVECGNKVKAFECSKCEIIKEVE